MPTTDSPLSARSQSRTWPTSAGTAPVRLASAIALGVLLVVLPGGFDSPLGGPPLGAVGRAALGALFLLGTVLFFFPPSRTPGRLLLGVLAALVAVKAVLGIVAVPHGWRGEYQFGDTGGRMHSARFFWRYASRDHRIDRLLAFTADDFDLHFFNDLALFGYPPYTWIRREERFPLSVRWSGYLELTTPRRVAVVVSGAGRVEFAVDDHWRTWLNPRAVRLELPLAAGRPALHAAYEKPAGVAPQIAVIPVDASSDVPLPVTPVPTDGRAWGALRATSLVVLGGLLVLMAAVAGNYLRAGVVTGTSAYQARVGAVLATVFLVTPTVQMSIEALGRTAFLHAGGDPLFYGSGARDILHQGLLMLQGRPLGSAVPFYFYPFYPYVLALTHALVGEDVSAIFLLNGLAMGTLPMLFWGLGWKRLQPAAAVAGFVGLTAFAGYYVGPFLTFDQPAFTDFVFLAFVFAALVALARALAEPRPRSLVAAGALIALGAATRPSLMTLVYLAPVSLWLAMHRPPLRRWLAACAWLLGGVFVGLLPFTLRNAIAAGQFVVLVNSWIQIPYFLIPPEVADRPGGVPGLVEALVMARGIFLADPLGTLWVEARKLLFTLGLTAAGPTGPGLLQANGLSVLTLLFVVAAARRRLRGPTGVAVVTFAISHLAAMIVAAPWTFHYKTIIPLHAAFLFGATFLLDGDSGAHAEVRTTQFTATEGEHVAR